MVVAMEVAETVVYLLTVRSGVMVLGWAAL